MSTLVDPDKIKAMAQNTNTNINKNTNTPPTNSKPWDARLSHHIPHDASYYSKCLVGGALACGLTHTAVTPLDVVKCNMQTNPGKFNGMLSGFSIIKQTEGTRALIKGWHPTCIGYHLQGMFKFGCNEIFKDTYANLVGEDNAIKYRALIWAAASASAEAIADVALCPFEMVKVKIQTSKPGTFPLSTMKAVQAMRMSNTTGGSTSLATRLTTGFPFGSLVPLWSRNTIYCN